MAYNCKILEHKITVEFTCPIEKIKSTQTVNNPNISEGKYYEDWTYNYFFIKCNVCGKEHSLEL